RRHGPVRPGAPGARLRAGHPCRVRHRWPRPSGRPGGRHRRRRGPRGPRPVPAGADRVKKALTGYHSPQVEVDVRLNTNESPYPPPDGFVEALAREVRAITWHRYPDRSAAGLREAVADRYGVAPENV